MKFYKLYSKIENYPNTLATVLPISAGESTTFIPFSLIILHFGLCGIFCTTYNSTSVPHSSTFRSSLTCYKTNNWFCRTTCFIPSSSFQLLENHQFTNHHYCFSFWVINNNSKASLVVVPIIGSPPIPIAVETP